MRAIITLVCLFTPLLGWIALVFFMQAWSREDELQQQLAKAGVKPKSTVEQVGDGLITGVLIILFVVGVTYILVIAGV